MLQVAGIALLCEQEKGVDRKPLVELSETWSLTLWKAITLRLEMRQGIGCPRARCIQDRMDHPVAQYHLIWSHLQMSIRNQIVVHITHAGQAGPTTLSPP